MASHCTQVMIVITDRTKKLVWSQGLMVGVNVTSLAGMDEYSAELLAVLDNELQQIKVRQADENNVRLFSLPASLMMELVNPLPIPHFPFSLSSTPFFSVSLN